MLIALACLSAIAQQGSEVPVVNLNVVALDSHGQPVTDLTAADFEIADAGKARAIAYIRHIDRRLAAMPAPGPNEFSNRTGAVIPHATVILLDLMNMRFNTRSLAANQIVHYLQSLESADYLYLYFLTIDGRIFTVRGLPGNAGATSETGDSWTRQIKQVVDNAMRTVLRTRPIDMDVAVRTQLTYIALDRLAAELSGVPGRKNIVWVTDGVPLTLGPIRSDTGDVVDFTPMLKKLSAALDRAQIAIYPSRQIMIGSSDAPPDEPGVPNRGGAGGGVLSTETLKQFASMTGGRPDGGRDIGAAVAQAMIDARTSYALGYYEPLEGWDSKFHKLRVTCKRKGVRLQTKTGYYAWPEDPADIARQAIQTTMAQSLDAAEIGIRATVSGRHVQVKIDPRDIVVNHGKLRIAVVTRGPVQVKFLDVNAAANQSIGYEFDVPPDPAVTSARVIVLDDISQNIGSLTLPLKRPAP